jgi:putative SOS response-associated peptidase YedK
VAGSSPRALAGHLSYFEWITEKGQKIPFYIHSDDPQQLLHLAGMYDVWTDPKTGEKRYTCTVVTTESSPQLAHIHVRTTRDHRLPLHRAVS